MLKTNTLIFLSLLFFTTPIFSQKVFINYENPDFLEVCDSAIFEIILTADDAEVKDITVEVWLPDGINYNAGSVLQASEEDISNPQRPVFRLPNLDANVMRSFTISAFAECSLISDINSGKTFANTITANFEGGSERAITQPYLVETGFLLIKEIDPEAPTLTFGDEIIRRISIQNTRIGRLKSFDFMDNHQGGFTITTNGDELVNDPMFYSARFDESHFRNIGNGDEYFDLDEILVVEEKILITDCGDVNEQSLSYITVQWGCDSTTCQSSSRSAFINFEESTKFPVLEFMPNIDLPNDFCVDNIYNQSLTIENSGNDEARNIQIKLLPGSENSGIILSTLKVDSAGVDIPFVVNDQLNAVNADCPSLQGTWKDVVITFPIIPEGEAFIISFQTQFCEEACGTDIPPLAFEYFYTRNCPPNLPVSGADAGFYSDQEQIVKDSISFYIGNFVRDDETYRFRYDLFSDFLVDSSGTLLISFVMPCGLTWANIPMLLDGNPPESVTVEPFGFGSRVELEYRVPFTTDHVFSDFFLSFDCVPACYDANPVVTPILTSCATPEICRLGRFTANPIDTSGQIPVGLYGRFEVEVESRFIPDNSPVTCGFSDCEPFDLFWLCPDVADVNPPYQIPAYVDFQTSFRRKNYGQRDDNDDQIKDSDAQADLGLVRTDRFIPGDTSITLVNGTVINDVAGHESSIIRLRIIFEGHTIDNGIDMGSAVVVKNDERGVRRDSALFSESRGIRHLGGEIVVFDRSSNSFYSAPLPRPLVQEDSYGKLFVINTRPEDIRDEWLFMIHNYEIDLENAPPSGGNFPQGFKLEEGDQVSFEVRHRMIFNANQRILNLRQETCVNLYNQPGSFESFFTCDSPYNFFQLSGITFNRFLGNFSGVPCGEFDNEVGSGMNIRLGKTNFFPYEFRSLAKVFNWDFIIADGFRMKETRLVGMGHLDQDPPRHEDLVLTAQVRGDTFKYDIEQFQDPLYDESFYFNLLHKLESEPIGCSLDSILSLKLKSRVEFNHDFPDLPDVFDDVNTSSIGIRSLLPRLVMDSNLPKVLTDDGEVTWDFSLDNDSDHASNNTWMYIESENNLLTNLTLRNGNTTLNPSQNGLYQLGDLLGMENFDLSVSGNFEFCGSERLQVIFGWNCDPLGSVNQFACAKDTFYLEVIAPSAELEMDITSPQGSYQLCEQLPYHTVRVFNADLGSAFNLKLRALMPPGLVIVPGSCQLAYPSSSNNFVNINDPTDLGAGNYLWEVSELQSDLKDDGLLGVQNDPRHSVSIRFLSITECGLIANAPIIFSTSGELNCELQLNNLSKPSLPIEIDGTEPDYETQISLTNQPTVQCGGDVAIDFSIELLGTSRSNDSIIITLPEGVTYIPNSYVRDVNAPTDDPLVETRGLFQTLKWKIRDGLAANSKVQFTLSLMGFEKGQDDGCGNKSIQVQTIQAQEALCVSTNQLCPISVQTGGGIFEIQVEYPFFTIQDFFASGSGNMVNYQIDIENQGAATGYPLTVAFYLDEDSNGFLTTGDQLISTAIFTGTIGINEVITLSGNLNIDPDDICRLMAVVSPDDNCSCEFAQSLTSGTISGPTVFNACSEEVIDIGVPSVSGSDYFWNTPLNITCTDCPMTDFSYQNVGIDTMSFNYEITEEGGPCPVRHLITVIVYPEPQVFASDQEICAGEEVILTSTVGSSYNWQGPGIVDATLDTQRVRPIETTTYEVEIQTEGDCSDQLDITIEVTPSPDVNAGEDTVMCNVVNPIMLNAGFNPNYDYFWEPIHQLDDFNIHNPTIVVNTTATFTVTVMDRQTGCEAMDDILVGFEDVPDLAISPDATICAGEAIQLQVNGADTYTWSPFSSLSNGDSAITIASPSSTTTYFVTGTNQGACSKRDSVTITVEGFIKNTAENVVGCQGDPLLIFGNEYTTDTMVCRTFISFVDGCDSTHCVTAEFVPAITQEDVVLCEGDTIELFGEPVFEPNQYCETFQTIDGCDSTHCYMVRLELVPNETPIFDTLKVEIGESIQLSLPEGYDRYEWTPSTGLDCDTCAVVNASPEITTDYIGSMFNESGCSVSFRFHLVVVEQCSAENVEIPNIFSPNGDGRNDLFKPKQIAGVEEVVHLKVFNRWGQKIYEGSGATACWDGTTKGKDSPTDVYVYQIEIGCGTETSIKTSDLTLIR